MISKIFIFIILILLVVNAVQVFQTDTSIEFARTIGHDNIYLAFENEQLREMLKYSQENNGELPEFIPIDYNA